MADAFSYSIPAPPNGLATTRPNIVIFMPDQLRYDALGFTGNAAAMTPNIDAFCSRGTRFTNCFAQNSMCTQSRCSMFLGLYPHVSGHRSLHNMIKPWEPNMFRSLKESGYHVACLAPRGDMYAPSVTEMSMSEYGFIDTPDPDLMPGFSKAAKPQPGKRDEGIWSRLFYGGVRDSQSVLDYDEAAVRSAEKWLENPPNGPWVLFLPLIFPHVPFRVEEPYFSMFDRQSMPRPANFSDKTGYEPRYMQEIRTRFGLGRATPEIWAEISAVYYGMISRLDDQFGRIISKLDALDLWSSTVTLFFTDHGEYLGDHGLVEKWPSGLSETLIHEPLVIAGAGLPSGRTNDEMAEMVDLLPTIFQLCGIDQTFPHNGKSLLPTIMGNAPHKEYAFAEGGFLKSEEPIIEVSPYPYDLKTKIQHDDPTTVGKSVCIKDKAWTYIYRLYEPAELYSRSEDRYELHNLAGLPEYQHIVRMMEGVIFRWMIETSDFIPWKRDPRGETISLKAPKV